MLWAGDWPEPAVSPGWTLYCLDVAGSDQHSHFGALTLEIYLYWYEQSVRPDTCHDPDLIPRSVVKPAILQQLVSPCNDISTHKNTHGIHAHFLDWNSKEGNKCCNEITYEHEFLQWVACNTRFSLNWLCILNSKCRNL